MFQFTHERTKAKVQRGGKGLLGSPGMIVTELGLEPGLLTPSPQVPQI